MYRPNLKSVALSVPEIIANKLLGGVENPNIGEEEAVGGWYRSKGPVQKGAYKFLQASIVTFYLALRFSDIAAFVLQHTTSSHPTSSLPEISPCSPGNRWMAFGLRRAKVLG